MTANISALEAALPRLGASDQRFARSLIEAARKYGNLTPKQWPWVGKLVERANAPAPVAVQVGDMKPVLAIFDRAADHLKFPAIVLGVAGVGEVRLTRAGARAKVPGSITVTSARDEATGERDWFGRVLVDGRYEPSRNAPAGIEAHLRRFAAEPAKVAAEHGRLTGRCCFCNQALKDERSTAVGYGKTCAGHYGMPWGAERTDLPGMVAA